MGNKFARLVMRRINPEELKIGCLEAFESPIMLSSSRRDVVCDDDAVRVIKLKQIVDGI